MRTVTLSGTSNSGTILSVGTPDSSTGRRSKSTTSTWNSRSQRELTVNQLSGKLGADHDEAYALIREALTATGDIIPDDGTLTIRLDPLSAPRRTRALTALCDQLTA